MIARRQEYFLVGRANKKGAITSIIGRIDPHITASTLAKPEDPSRICFSWAKDLVHRTAVSSGASVLT